MRRVHYETIDSTNSQARLLALDHPGEVLLVTAAEQSAGRGRHGRVWQSPRGGAWMSLVWPMRRAPRNYAPTSLVAAIAVLRALRAVAPEAAGELCIKWPNDLLLADRKVAGILCEQCLGESPRRQGAIVIGVGVNVDFKTEQLSCELRHPPTTLRAATGRCVAVEAVIAAVSERLIALLSEFESDGLSEKLLSELRENLAYVGAVKCWSTSHQAITGRVLGVDERGRLLLDGPSGLVACEAGELAWQDQAELDGKTELTGSRHGRI